MILDEDMTQNLRKELKELNERTEKKMTTFATNEIESIFRRNVQTELLRKSTTKKISLLWSYR